MFWMVATNIRAHERYDDLERASPPGFSMLNEAGITAAYQVVWEQYHDHEFWEIPNLTFSRIPTPRIRITDPTFDVDMFSYGDFTFVSRKLRRVIGNVSAFARFRSVDMEASVPAVQAIDYEMFEVSQFGNPFDPTRMAGDVRPVRQPDGSLRDEWVMDWFGRVEKSPDVYFRDDFVAPAPMFRGLGSYWTFATDELADRVQRAGIDDVLFLDITGPALPDRDRSRPKP